MRRPGNLFIALMISTGIMISLTKCKKDESIDEPLEEITDIDSNVYKVEKIAGRYWMAENLKTTKYNDGTDIPNLTASEWAETGKGAYCWLDNDAETYKDEYGALYNWYAVNTEKLCPTGWHVPTKNEFDVLLDSLGGSVIAGGLLKEEGTVHWLEPNSGATNQAGFSALGTGRCSNESGNFEKNGELGNFWTSSKLSSPYAYYLLLTYNYKTAVTNGSADLNYGFSVRCIKDVN